GDQGEERGGMNGDWARSGREGDSRGPIRGWGPPLKGRGAKAAGVRQFSAGARNVAAPTEGRRAAPLFDGGRGDPGWFRGAENNAALHRRVVHPRFGASLGAAREYVLACGLVGQPSRLSRTGGTPVPPHPLRAVISARCLTHSRARGGAGSGRGSPSSHPA